MSQFSENRRLARNSIILALRIVLMIGITFFTSRILLQELGVSDFGLYGVVGGIVAIFGSLRGIFASSVQRFLNFEMGKGDYSQTRVIFSIGFLIHIVVAIIFILLSQTVGLWYLNNNLVLPADRLFAANWVFQFSIITAFLTIIAIPYDALLIAHERMNFFALISLAEVVLKFIAVIILPYMSFDNLIIYSIFIFSITLITRIFTVMYCNYSFPEFRIRFIWDKKLFADLATFSGWNFLGNSAHTFSNEGVNLILNFFGSTPINAARQIAFQVRNAFIQLISSVLLAVNPHIIKLYAKKDFVKLESTTLVISKLLFFIMFILCMPTIFLTDFLLAFWLVEVPNYAEIFVKIILFYVLIRAFHYPIDIIFKASGKMKNYQLTDSLILILNLPLAFLLLKYGFDYYTVFLLMPVLEFINLVAILFLANHMGLLNVKKYIRSVLIPCFLTVLCCVPLNALLLNSFQPFTMGELMFVFVMLVIINIIGAFYLGLVRSERKVVVTYILTKIQKNR